MAPGERGSALLLDGGRAVIGRLVRGLRPCAPIRCGRASIRCGRRHRRERWPDNGDTASGPGSTPSGPCELGCYCRGGRIRTAGLVNPIHSRCQAALHPAVALQSVPSRDVPELAWRDTPTSTLHPVEDPRVRLAASPRTRPTHVDAVVRVASSAVRRRAVESRLRSEALDRGRGLLLLDDAEPATDLAEDPLYPG